MPDRKLSRQDLTYRSNSAPQHSDIAAFITDKVQMKQYDVESMESSKLSDRHMPILGGELTLFHAMAEMYINSGNESVSQWSQYAVCNRKIAARDDGALASHRTWHINKCQQFLTI
jgi:hypothetical protein